MTTYDHLGFITNYSNIQNSIFVPRYYNPEIPHRLEELKATHKLVTIAELVDAKKLSIKAGREVGKMAYGTGTIPFVRTSDLSNWELITDTKQGVSDAIYRLHSAKQDVREGDILLVKDGTYLIGQTCMITKYDLPLLYQSHVLKLRVLDDDLIDNYLLLALLNAPVVKKQIRSIQFTADIIDTIGNRLQEVVLPVPREEAARNDISEGVKNAIETRTKYRERIRGLPKEIAPTSDDDFEEQRGNTGFLIQYSKLKNGIFIPRYYDPVLEENLKKLRDSHHLVSLEALVKNKVITWATGKEIGKMAYGTGKIPFVRTSDIINWELKTDPKQGVSEEIYATNKQDVQAGDILLVRDGTYLVGTNCIVTKHDEKMLFCGGLYKLRVIDRSKLDPYLLLALLNTPIVKRQIRSKQFTRDIIDTIGKRLFEVLLPIPKSPDRRAEISGSAEEIVHKRIDMRLEMEALAKRAEYLVDIFEDAYTDE